MATGAALPPAPPPPRAAEATPGDRRTLDRRVGGVRLGARPDFDVGPQWVVNLQLQRLLAIGMFGCAAWAFTTMLRVAGFTLAHTLALFVVSVAIFAIGVAIGGREEGRSLRRYTDYDLGDWLLLLVPILLLLKLLPHLLEGPAALGREIAGWVDDPAHFFDATLVWSFILVFAIWDFSLRVAEHLQRLSLQPGELPPAAGSPAYDEWLSSPYRFVDHRGAWHQLMWYFVAGGFATLCFTGLALIPPAQLANADRPEVQGIIPHVVLYYLFGFIFAGQTTLDRLRADWLRHGVSVQPGIARRWLAYCAALVAVALVLALLLPTSFARGLSEQDPTNVIGVLLWPLRALTTIIMGAITWLLAHLASLLFGLVAGLFPTQEREVPPAAPPPLLQPTPGTAPAPGAPSIGTRVAFGLLFYVLPGAVALYAIWNTWRKRRAIWEGLRTFVRDVRDLTWGAILELVAALWRLFSFGSPRLLRLAPAAVQARWRRRPGAALAEGPFGWLRLRGLAPRLLIQYFYVSLARRAEALGWGRRRGQTPYEYSQELAARLPERRGEIEVLTEAFVQARYSRRPIGEADARRARGPWERIRGALQTRHRARQLGQWVGLGGT